MACATAGTEAARFVTDLPGIKQAAELEDAATETAVDGVEYVAGKPSYGRSSQFGIPTIELSTPGIVKDAAKLADGAADTVTGVFK